MTIIQFQDLIRIRIFFSLFLGQRTEAVRCWHWTVSNGRSRWANFEELSCRKFYITSFTRQFSLTWTNYNVQLQRLARRLRRAAARCGCRTMGTMDVQQPSLHAGPSGGQGSSESTRDSVQDTAAGTGKDMAEEIGTSQLQGAPSTQESQPPAQRARRPRDCYTPGTDALGRKGKGKTRRQWR